MATAGAIEQRLDVAFLAYESGIVYTFGGWLFLILCTVDSLIQARTNFSYRHVVANSKAHNHNHRFNLWKELADPDWYTTIYCHALVVDWKNVVLRIHEMRT